jgi:hypothetical protein
VRKSDILGPRLVRPEFPPAPFSQKPHGDIIANLFSHEFCGQPNAGGLSDDKHALSSNPIARRDLARSADQNTKAESDRPGFSSTSIIT